MGASFKPTLVVVGLAAVLAVSSGSLRADDRHDNGVVLRTEKSAERHAELMKRIESSPNIVMKASGLAGAMGGVTVRVSSSAPQEIILPVPQLASGQVPVCLFVRNEPSDAVEEYRLWNRGGGNVVLRVRLVGKRQDVKIEWSSVVLLVSDFETSNRVPPEAFRSATACVQSRSLEVKKLAEELWPASDRVVEFAWNIQRHIREMKQTAPPRSLDAVGILKSGMNGVCTANANLAAALMRSKGIACRSSAVIPPNGMKFEMHRIVEFFDEGKWKAFDPSSLTADIPAKPWRNIVMARTTTRDEETAMKPRMGVMIGCPYAQEVELLTPGVMLFGQDFFWTTAKPVADFDPSAHSIGAAKEKWGEFLKTGHAIDGASRCGLCEIRPRVHRIPEALMPESFENRLEKTCNKNPCGELTQPAVRVD